MTRWYPRSSDSAMRRKHIEEFVREYATGDAARQLIHPGHSEFLQQFLLAPPHSRTSLEDHVRKSPVAEDVAGEKAFPRPQFDQGEGFQTPGHLFKLLCQ